MKRLLQHFLPRLQKILVTDRDAAQENPVELRLDEKAAQYISGSQLVRKI